MTPETSVPSHAPTAHGDASLPQLLREVIDESQRLVRLEVELAKQDLTGQITDFKNAALFVGAGVALMMVALSVIIVGLLVAAGASGVFMIAMGFLALAIGVGLALWAVKRLPKPGERTLERLKNDARILKEHVA